MQDDNFSSAESVTGHLYNDFFTLMQGIPANEELPDESDTVHEEFQVTFTEELADLTEEIEVENVAMGIEETKEGNKEHELLYEDSRITVGESLLLSTQIWRLLCSSVVATSKICRGRSKNSSRVESQGYFVSWRQFFRIDLSSCTKRQNTCCASVCLAIFMLKNQLYSYQKTITTTNQKKVKPTISAL
jgi:hypothetical protein